MTRTVKPFEGEQLEQLLRMRAQRATTAEIGKALGYHPTEVSRKTPEQYKNKSMQRPKATLSLPNGAAIEMTHDEYVQLSGKAGNEPALVVAAEIAQDSLKVRVLREVALNGPFEDVGDLCKAIRIPTDRFDAHEVTHVLHSLSKQSKVKFRTHRAPGAGTALLLKIEATRQGYGAAGVPGPATEVGRWRRPSEPPQKPGDRTDFRTHQSRAEGGPVTRENARSHAAANPEHHHDLSSPPPPPAKAPVAPSPVPPPTRAMRKAWPLLEDLRGRWGEIEIARAKADRYLEAATALEQVDPEESARMLARAEAMVPKLMAVEAEYLEFARAHGYSRRS